MGDPSTSEPGSREPGSREPVVVADGECGLAASRVVSANTQGYLERSAGERAEAIAQLSALMSATHAELLDVIQAADVAGDWVDDGATGPTPWLVGHNGIAHETAREWLRVADAVQYLPALRVRYAAGAMSWDQIRHATKCATSVDDAELAERLPGLSVRQLALMARQRHPVSPGAEPADCDPPPRRGLAHRIRTIG